MTALESLIAELRKLHRIAVGGGIWNHNDVATIYTALPSILDALEAAEKRAETLRVALERCREKLQDQVPIFSPCPACREPNGRHLASCTIDHALAAAERALKGEG